MSKKANPYAKRDRFTHKAKSAGFPARSVYKLEEIDAKLRILRPGQRVLDLGAAPGSWSMFAAKKIGAQGALLAVDLQPLRVTLPANSRFVQQDIAEINAATVEELLGCGEIHVVLSDMAPSTTGHRGTDQARSYVLFEQALHLALQILPKGGHFVGKIFQGPDFEQARHLVRKHFQKTNILRPEATRKVSYEVFLCGTSLVKEPGS